jgi:hypothetical protein
MNEKEKQNRDRGSEPPHPQGCHPPHYQGCHPERVRRGGRAEGSAVVFPSDGTRRNRLLGPALILFAAFVAVVPQLLRGNSCGHDFDVHLVSWLDCLNAWRHGIPYPHWAPSPNYSAGEPRFVYYPPLTWMLGAALGAILPWHFAPIALTFLILAGTGWATRALALEALDDLPATMAGCVAIFSGFALFTAYERSAFPEFAGGFWLPLILLFVLRDRYPAAPPFHRAFSGSTAPLVVALAGAWLSNLPLGVMAGYLLAAVALLWAVVNKTWAPLLRAALAVPLGLGLAAIYWLPAALKRHQVAIAQATEDPGYNFENSWLFAHHANPLLALHDVVLRQASWIAVAMIAVAVAGLFVCWRRGTLPVPNRGPHGQIRVHGVEKITGSRWWIPLAAIPIVVLFLLFPISRPVWRLLPEMPFLQYPWRWLEAVEAPMAIFFVAALWPSRRDARRRRGIVLAACAALFLAATVFAGTGFFQVCYPEDTVPSVLADYDAGTGFEGMSEYGPPGSDESLIATGLPDACLVGDRWAVLGKPDPDDPDSNPVWSVGQGTCQATFAWAGGAQVNPEHRALLATMPQSGILVLRLLNFPAWHVRVNGRLDSTWPHRADGLIAIPVPQGPVEITVDWTTGYGDLAGRLLSALSAFLLAVLWRCERHRDRSRLT